MNRRELIQALLGASAAATLAMPGCGRPQLPREGRLLAPDLTLGHKLREGFCPEAADDASRDVSVAIVGGGIAGLAAGWRLRRAGIHDFALFDIEKQLGGTAAYSNDGVSPYPWGAHYLTTPMPENHALLALLQEMGTVEGWDAEGRPLVAEQFLCREPEERLFIDGTWIQGLYPELHASAEDRRQLAEFREEIDAWVGKRDSQGRRMFAIPMVQGSDEAEVRTLDQLSMAAWMDRHGWTSPRLRWLVDYACRDDYGLRIEQTSAWAGVFYFVSRVQRPGDDSQAVITWPQGNGRVVQHLADQLGDRIYAAHAVCRVSRPPPQENGKTLLNVYQTQTQQAIRVRADRVIFAAPQFLAPYLIEGFSARTGRSTAAFQYGSWVVANLHLSGRPKDQGFPMSWDNVIYDSPALGYVVATHQTGRDHGPTVLTWYYPLANADPSVARQQLLKLSWADWADVALTDLEKAHPDIRSLTTRLDVMRWGHAMIQPRTGFLWSEARREAALPDGPIHFAGTDLSGIALLEEAFYHGVRAAEEVLVAQGHEHRSLLSKDGPIFL